MGNNRPSCVAANEDRFYLITLQSLSANSSSDSSLSPYNRRIVLLQSPSYPTSLETTTWAIVGIHPSTSQSSSLAKALDVLASDLTSGTSNCQVDTQGNFVWISSNFSTMNPSDPSNAQVASKPTGVQYSIGAGGGVWSLINFRRLSGAQGVDYIWSNEYKVNALFTLARGVFVHALASTAAPGVILGVLNGDNLVQSNRTLFLDAMTYGIPRAIAFSNHTMYLLGSNKVLSLLPMNTSVRDIASLQAAQELLIQTPAKHFPLSNLSDDCMDSQLTTLHSTAVGSNVYLVCAGVLPTTALRVYAFDGALLKGPYHLPLLYEQTNISSFAAVSALSTAVPGADPLLLSMSESTLGMTWGLDGLKPDTTSYAIDNGALNNATTSPSPSPSSVGDPIQSKSTSAGKVAGGTVAVICILGLVCCRIIRRNRARARIDQTTRRHDGPPVASPDVVWVRAQNIVVPPSPVPLRPGMNYGAAPTEEQLDLAQIEMQRMLLGPPPAFVGSSAGVVTPLAPPQAASISEDTGDIPLNPFATAITASASAPHLHSYQHLHPYQSQAASEHQYPEEKQHLHQMNTHHLAHQTQEVVFDEDSYSQQIPPDSPSGSSTTNLLPTKAPNTHADHHGSGSMNQSYYQSQSESAHSRKKAWADDGSEDTTPPPPPPPPYLANARRFLNSPSAPSADDHSSGSRENRSLEMNE